MFFVADEDLDIYPEGFGLEPISLKTHQATSSEVKAVVTDLKSILTEPMDDVQEDGHEVINEVVPETEPVVEVVDEVEAEPVSEVEVEPESDPEPVVEVVVDESKVEEPTECVEETPVEIPVEASAEELVEELPTVEFVEEEVVSVQKPLWKVALKVVMWMAIAFIALIVVYVAVAHLCPEWIDQFLYTPEELELLNNRYE